MDGTTRDELRARLNAGTHECEAWQPRFFRLARPEDRRELDVLLAETPGVQVFDAIEDQLVDLIKTRSPSRRLTDAAAKELIPALLGETAIDDYGVWVYYAWSRRLVHLLDEAEFIELRTNRNKYKLTPEEQAKLSTKRVGVVGLSVGQMVATTMALERSVGELRLADFDRLDLSNLNRIRSGVHNLGTSKVLLTAREIAEIDPFLRVVLYPVGVHGDNIHAFLLKGGKLDVLIDECDSIDIKLKLRAAARLHRIPVVMETSDRSLIDIERFDLEPTRPIFHGLVGNIDPERLANLSTEEKIPYVLKIIGQDTMSNRMVTSMMEIESSIKTWPQLGSCVVYGGGATADIVRRINLGQLGYSGRFIADIENTVPNDRHDVPPEPEAPPHLPPLTVAQMEREADALAAPGERLPWDPELARVLVGAAALAPSGGNMQPWLWLLRDGRLHLFHDYTRSESLTDFRGLAGMAALGAAAESVRLAAHARGIELSVDAFPGADGSPLVAAIDRLPGPGPRAEARWREDLAALLGARHTGRKSGPRRPLDPGVLAALRDATRSIDGADLHVLTRDDDLAEIAALMGECDRLRLINRRFNREMFGEVRWTAEEAQTTRDGLLIDTLELTASDRAALTMCSRADALAFLPVIGGGRGLTKISTKAIASASGVGLLTVPRVTRADFFRGGRALQRMWLAAHGLEVALWPMTVLIYMFTRLLHGDGEDLDALTIDELRALRPRFERLFPGAGQGEVLLFRLAPAEAPTLRSLRRPVEEILHVSER